MVVTAPICERRPLAALLLATLIALVGGMFTCVAIPWLVLGTTGSAARASLPDFSEALRSYLGGLLGDAIVGRRGASASPPTPPGAWRWRCSRCCAAWPG